MNIYGLILAGGSGSRLWPLSRDLYPKQFLKLSSDKSLLQATFERLSAFIKPENIVSITNAKHLTSVKMQLGETTVLAEPIAKNTAPAIVLAVKFITQHSEDDPIILVTPSDSLIKNIEQFQNTVEKGKKLAKEGYIVTFGVKPNYPETGYGYINVTSDYKVKEFVEKPNFATAQKYLEEGTYFWNAGMFMFKASVLLNEIERLAPEIAEITKKIDFDKSNEISSIEFEKMPNISIDYAVMEKSDKIALVKLESDWNDLGSWQSIYNTSEKDTNGNVFVGSVLDKDSKNSLVYSSSKLVVTIGLEDTIIVETEDAILACKKERSQDVKQIYETLRTQNNDVYLVHKTVYRPWGYYTEIDRGKGFLVKRIFVNAGQKLSVQSHNHRSEHWVCISGTATVLLNGEEHILGPGKSIDIPVKAIHSLQNPSSEGGIEIIEVQKGNILSEDDIIRYEDIYGRV